MKPYDRLLWYALVDLEERWYFDNVSSGSDPTVGDYFTLATLLAPNLELRIDDKDAVQFIKDLELFVGHDKDYPEYVLRDRAGYRLYGSLVNLGLHIAVKFGVTEKGQRPMQMAEAVAMACYLYAGYLGMAKVCRKVAAGNLKLTVRKHRLPPEKMIREWSVRQPLVAQGVRCLTLYEPHQPWIVDWIPKKSPFRYLTTHYRGKDTSSIVLSR